MPVPALGTMHANVDFLSRPDKGLRQSRRATRAKNYARLTKGAVHVLVPPACVPEFDDIAPRRIKLANNVLEAHRGVSVARRKLKQKAAHPVAEKIGNHAKIFYEGFCAP